MIPPSRSASSCRRPTSRPPSGSPRRRRSADSCGDCRALPLADFGTVAFSEAKALAAGHGGSIVDGAWSANWIELASGTTAVPSERTPPYGRLLQRHLVRPQFLGQVFTPFSGVMIYVPCRRRGSRWWSSACSQSQEAARRLQAKAGATPHMRPEPVRSDTADCTARATSSTPLQRTSARHRRIR